MGTEEGRLETLSARRDKFRAELKVSAVNIRRVLKKATEDPPQKKQKKLLINGEKKWWCKCSRNTG